MQNNNYYSEEIWGSIIDNYTSHRLSGETLSKATEEKDEEQEDFHLLEATWNKFDLMSLSGSTKSEASWECHPPTSWASYLCQGYKIVQRPALMTRKTSLYTANKPIESNFCTQSV